MVGGGGGETLGAGVGGGAEVLGGGAEVAAVLEGARGDLGSWAGGGVRVSGGGVGDTVVGEEIEETLEAGEAPVPGFGDAAVAGEEREDAAAGAGARGGVTALGGGFGGAVAGEEGAPEAWVDGGGAGGVRGTCVGEVLDEAAEADGFGGVGGVATAGGGFAGALGVVPPGRTGGLVSLVPPPALSVDFLLLVNLCAQEVIAISKIFPIPDEGTRNRKRRGKIKKSKGGGIVDTNLLLILEF